MYSRWGRPWDRVNLQEFIFGFLERYWGGYFRTGSFSLKGDYVLSKDIDAFNQCVDSRPGGFVDQPDYRQKNAGMGVLANWGDIVRTEHARMVKEL